jgi:beta-glucanase (GH16 family)
MPKPANKAERRERSRRSSFAVVAALAALGLAACVKVGQPEAAPATHAALTKAPDGRRLQLTFAEEFDSFRPYRNGHGVWRTVFRDGKPNSLTDLRSLPPNKELQLYVDEDFPGIGPHWGTLNPFSTQNGVLTITARPAPGGTEKMLGGYRYASGLITTQPSFAQAYGYFEMRAKLPMGKGLWPAFWLLPADLSWPPELDVMESIGDASEVYFTAHSKLGSPPALKVALDPDVFHVYGVAWDPKQIVWYVDGREVKRQATPADMSKPMYMLANLAVGGGWPGNPDDTTDWPARYSIDYIRAYRFVP